MSDASEYKLYTEAYVNDIAEALKEKYTKPTDPETYTIRQMANAVRGLAIPNPDWTEIGYKDTPKGVIDDFSYSKKIYDEWDPTVADRGGSITGFSGDRDLRWFPAVDMSNVTSAVGMFKGCPNLEGLYEHQTFPALVNGYELVAQPVAGSKWKSNIDWDMPNCTDLTSAFHSLGGSALHGITEYEYSLGISVKLNIPKIQNLWKAFEVSGGDVSGSLIRSIELTTGPDLTILQGAFSGVSDVTKISISYTSNVGKPSFEGDGNQWRGLFAGKPKLVELSELDMQYCGDIESLFDGCSSLRSIDVVNNNIGYGRVSYNAIAAFRNCTALEEVPMISFRSNPASLAEMFLGCPNLSDTSLANILRSCSVVSDYGTKTLYHLGFREDTYPLSRWESLGADWTNFLAAGWTTGY